MQALTTTFFSLSLILLATSAFGQASINDCEKIQAADAYNQCLAKFGPPAKSGNLEPERPGDIKSSGAEAAAGAGPAKGARVSGGSAHGRHRGRGSIFARRARGGSRVHVAHKGAGRKSMTISVGK